MSLADVEYVIDQILVQNIPGCFGEPLHATDPQALTLAQCVEHQTLVLANYLALARMYLAGLCRQIFAQKSREITLANKADSGAVLFVKDIKTGLLGQFPYHGFFQFTNREKCFCQLLMSYGVQEVTLVLIVIQSSQ